MQYIFSVQTLLNAVHYSQSKLCSEKQHIIFCTNFVQKCSTLFFLQSLHKCATFFFYKVCKEMQNIFSVQTLYRNVVHFPVLNFRRYKDRARGGCVCMNVKGRVR